jgi:amino acid adenylation domain-containing protein
MSDAYLKTQGWHESDDTQIHHTEDLIAQFLGHVSSSPDAIALVTTEKSWTYRCLYTETLKWKVTLSQHVASRAVIFLPRTPRLVAILLALQWLRVTYTPVDLDTPMPRLLSIIEDSQAQTLLHDDALGIEHQISCLSLNVEKLNHIYSHENSVSYAPAALEALAYIIYTSGSTGKPKGVAITYQALNHFLVCMSHVFLHEKHAMLLAVTTIAFDIAQLELWLPLWQGKTLFLATQKEHRDPIVLKNILEKYPITLLQSTPAFWSMLYAVGWKKKLGLVALCGGEALSEALAARLLDSVDALWNMYGPTEATVWCATKQIVRSHEISIGRPISGMSFVVLNEEKERVKPHTKGELYIAGPGLAQGYVNRDDLNRERFIMFEGLRYYRVGDLAIEIDDGEFIIVGRTDHQIKLRGFRIELEEIEQCIRQYEPISNAAVVVHEEQIIAYITLSLEKEYAEHALIAFLKSVLPTYMLPMQYIVMDVLPLSLSGKIDRQALPKPVRQSSASTFPMSDWEKEVCQIWEKSLGCRVGLLDNFFSLGGHSLIAARIIAEVAQRWHKTLTLDILYHAPTVRAFAAYVEQAPIELERTHPSLKSTEWFSLTDYQAIFWLSQRFEPGLKVFNVVARRRFCEKLDADLLNRALLFLFDRHSVLSYRFNLFYPAQKYIQNTDPVTWVECSLIDSPCFEKQLGDSYDHLFYRHRWKHNRPMLLPKLFYLPDAHTELQICVSHLVADERALEIFFEDLCKAYVYQQSHERIPIQKPQISFEHYVSSKTRFYSQIEVAGAQHFWEKYLADTGYFPMPKKYVVSKMQGDAHHYVTEVDFPLHLLQAVKLYCVHHQVTLNDVFIAAVSLALQDCTQTPEHPVLVNTIKSTRTSDPLDQVMGCFLEMVAIKFALQKPCLLSDAAKAVQEAWMTTLPYQDIPSLIKYACLGRATRGIGRVKQMMISGLMKIYDKWVARRIPSRDIFQACAKIATHARKTDFFVCVNVLGSFIMPHARIEHPREIKIPSHSFPVMPLASVLDVWFYSEPGIFKPKLLIAGNLEPHFRAKLADQILYLLHDAQRKEHA